MASLHDLNLAWDLASHVVLLDGRGACDAGTRAAMMTPARLSAAFGVEVHALEDGAQRRFWSGRAGGGNAASRAGGASTG